MPTVFNDTDVAEALTSTMMITVTNMGTTPTPVPVMTSGTIPSTSAYGSRHTGGTIDSGIMSRLEGSQLNVDQPHYDWDSPDQHK